MTFRCVTLSAPLALIGSLGCTERAPSAAPQDAATAALYAACESHDDCQGTGLLCDDRRGCVECLESNDCGGSQECYRGLCQPEPGGGGDSDAGPGDDDSSGTRGDDDAPAADDDAAGDSNTDGDVGDDSDASVRNVTDASANDPSADPSDDADPGGEPDAVDDDADDDSGDAAGDDDLGDAAGDDDLGPTGGCSLRLPVTYRDFSGTHPDFGDHTCSDLVSGLVDTRLDAEGRPTLAGAGAGSACISSSSSFAEWYRDSDLNVRLDAELRLFQDGSGGWVNRFGPNGEPFTSTDDATERSGGASLAQCEMRCRDEAYNNHSAGCENMCRVVSDQEHAVLARIALLEAYIDEPSLLERDGGEMLTLDEVALEHEALTAELPGLSAATAACTSDCEQGVAAETAVCARTCKPCSYDPDQFCFGGEVTAHDGTPLFFPVDAVTGVTADLSDAKIPEQYGYNGWSWESEWFPNAREHNFYFTTQIDVEFVYDAAATATLEFVGDDDMWVFINGRLAVDLGGVHVPEYGAATLTPSLASSFDMEDGETYTLSIFHAERQMEGSSFQLRLTGFELLGVPCE